MVGKLKKALIFTSIRTKMILIFAVLLLIIGLSTALLSIVIFRHEYGRISWGYLGDVTRQTTNNLENSIEVIEKQSLQIITNTIIQRQLEQINTLELSSYELQVERTAIENELETIGFIDPDVISVSVVSLDGYESAVKQRETSGTLFAFDEEDIYRANGTSLWNMAIVSDKKRICMARAILNLSTMRPLGYLNIVYEYRFLGDIVRDNSTQFSSGAYVVDDNGTIVVTNYEEHLGKQFPFSLNDFDNIQKIRYDALNDTKTFYYIGERMQNGWTLIETVSVKDFYKNSRMTTLFTMVVAGILLLIGIALVMMSTAHITKPTQELLKSMNALGQGDDYPRVEVVSQDEIGQIGTEYNHMVDQLEILIEKVYKMEISQKQAEIEFLQMQINPHFLYNSLDTISWMAISKDDMDIAEMTIALAELLRATIKQEQYITLYDEMKTVKDYLFIQKQRFGDKISVQYDIDECAYPYLVPNFILQLLVENSIIHGLELKVGKGTLAIRIWVSGRQMYFNIADDGIGMTQDEIRRLKAQCVDVGEKKPKERSIGLKNVYRRLLLCYGEESILEIESKENEGTQISFSIPIQVDQM